MFVFIFLIPVFSDTTLWLVESPKEWRKISVWPWRGRCPVVGRTCTACFTVSASTKKSSSSSLFLDTWNCDFKAFSSVDIPGTVLMQLDWLHDTILALLVFIIHQWTRKKIIQLPALTVNLSFQRELERSCSFHCMCVVVLCSTTFEVVQSNCDTLQESVLTKEWSAFLIFLGKVYCFVTNLKC